MARKKDGSLRFFTDFRGLNPVTVTDAHLLPGVDAAVDQLSGSVFSVVSTFRPVIGKWS